MKTLSLKGRANAAGVRRLGNHRGAEGSEAAAHAAKDQMLKQRVSGRRNTPDAGFPAHCLLQS